MILKAPGKVQGKVVTLVEMFRRFPDDITAEAGFVKQRWPHGITCPHCGSTNVQTGAKHETMSFRCRENECAKRFSSKTGTVMEGSKLGFQIWMVAAYVLTTSFKSVSSMKLHRDLGINQRSAWFLAHRLRVALSEDGGLLSGPVEVEETCIGGRRKNSDSLWSMAKRACKGKFHKMKPKDLDLRTQELAARHSQHGEDTIAIMTAVASGMEHKWLRYRELIADDGLSRGARS